MFWSRLGLFSAALWTIVFGSSNLVAKPDASRAVKFKSDIIPLTAFAGQPFQQVLTDLLADQGSGTLNWSTSNDKPAWLTLDGPGNKISGTPAPSDQGLKSFRLGVQNNDTGAFARIDITVLIPPSWKENPLDLGDQYEDSPWQFDLNTRLTNPSGSQITFSVENPSTLPTWMTLTPSGILSGTPRRKDVGSYAGIVFVAKSKEGAVTRTSGKGRVVKVVKPPKWIVNPITLESAAEDFPYSQDISGTSFVSNPEATTLNFTLTGNFPKWVNITATGNIFGTPKATDVGDVSLKATFTTTIDGTVYTETTTVNFKVIHTNHTPVWKMDPIVFADHKTKTAFIQDLATQVTDPDGDKLNFRVVSGPNWAALSQPGMFTGTPQNTNLGNNEWVVEVSDGEFAPRATVRVKVFKLAPFWIAKPTVLPGAKEDGLYSQTLAAHVKNPDNDTLIFTKVSGPAWASISGAGTFSGTPKAMDVGANSFQATVSDGFSPTDRSELTVAVEHVNHPPIWIQDPINLANAKEKFAYTASLAEFAKDVDANETLTFSKVSGPAWASISNTGQVSGTPMRTDVGLNTFKVKVADIAGASAEVTVRIIVEKTNKAPVWTQDPIPFGNVLEASPLAFNAATFATDPDNDPLTFRKVSGSGWIMVSADGKLSGTPAKSDVGNASVVVEVSDGDMTAKVTLTGTVEAKILPPVIALDPIVLAVKERQVLVENLNQPKYVVDPQGLPLTFQFLNKLDWTELTSAGKLTLSPKFKDIGAYELPYRVSNSKHGVDGKVKITVVRDPRPPVWLEDPIRFQTLARMPFTGTVADKARDQDGLAITFTKKSGPAWLTVAADGKLSGTPQDSDLGANNFVLTVRNDLLGSDATLVITVMKNNRPPRWLQDPVQLGEGLTETPFNFDLAGFAKDDDGDALTFKKISGPAWLAVGANGKITGTPGPNDAGDYTATFAVTDGTAEVQAGGVGKIKLKQLPPIIHAENIKFTVKERQIFTENLNQPKYVEDPMALPLTFTLLDPTPWVTLSSQGQLELKPQFKQIGSHSLRLRVANAGLSTDSVILVTVIRDPRPPIWSENPIRFQTLARVPFSNTLAGKVTDLDGLPVTFTKKSGPAWLTVATDGKLSGTPQDSDIGEKTFVVTVKNDLLGADADVIITVLKNNRPPRWLQDPVQLGEGTTETPFQFDLAGFVSDDDNDPLTFKKIAGPAWLSVAANGKITGTPGPNDAGNFTATFAVSDGTAEVQAGGVVKIKAKEVPPVIHAENLKFTVKERQVFAENLNQPKYVEDPMGKPLTFELLDSAPWVSLTAQGQLELKPQFPQIGNHNFRFRLSNRGSKRLSTDGVIAVTVVRDPRPPVWSENPIRFQTLARVPFNNTLAGKVTDLDGLPVTFTKKSGPAWLTVATDGKLSGTPQDSDVGEKTTVVTVRNDLLGADADVIITVLKNNRPPRWLQDPVQLGEGLTETPFTFDLAGFVVDDDNDALTFKKISGPNWMVVAANGKITGTPGPNDAGDFTAKLAVSDGTTEVQANAVGKIKQKELPPIIHQNAIAFTVKERQVFTENLNQAKYVEDPMGKPLTFTLIDTAAWVSLTAQGVLELKPLFPQIGTHALRFRLANRALSTEGVINVTVVRDPRPPIWLEDPIRFQATAGKPFSASVLDKAKDLDGLALNFSKKSGPNWLSVGAGGQLSGTAAESDVGENRFVVTVRNDLLGADTNVIVTVVTGNHPPIWLQDPIVLEDGKVGKLYSQSVAAFASDPDNDPLTFSKVSGPEWVTVTSSGMVMGTPTNGTQGLNNVRVRVTDTKGAFAEATARILVLGEDNKPPKWVKDPIPLGQHKAEMLFQFDLKGLAIDENGDALTFRKVSGPAWLFVSADGMISGTPQKTDLGEYTALLEVSDGKATAQAGAFGKVIDPGGENPIIKPEALSFIIKERDTLTVNLNQPQYVYDPAGRPLQFQLLDPAGYLTLASNGTLVAKPLFNDIGDHSYRIRVTNDLNKSTDGSMFIRVVRDPRPPFWVEDPIRMDAKLNQPFTATLAGKAQDKDNFPLTFGKVSGPSWLSVASNGMLSGTPAQLGDFTFVVFARNDALAANATLIIRVQSNDPIVDKIQIDSITPGAASENLWVIDNSWPWTQYNKMVKMLKEDVHYYLEALDQGQVHHTSVLLSSDVARWKGIPQLGGDSTPLLKWNDNRWVDGFANRVNEMYNKQCYTSPIWAMFRFYAQAPTLSLYHNGYFTANTPMDVLILTPHTDSYASYAKGTAQASWTPDQYATSFIQFHEKEQQPYRISAVAPDCQQMMDPFGETKGQTAASNPFRTLTARTKGQYIPWDCHYNMEKTLKDYAQQVIFRAQVSAKTRIPLSKVPADPSKIQVYLAGKLLATDLWSYDASRREIVMRWDKIDLSTLKPGDVLEIRYTI